MMMPWKQNSHTPDTPKRSTRKKTGEEKGPGHGGFKRVRPLPGYLLEVTMETGAVVQFDFRTRLNTARFGKLRDEALFASAYTDGLNLIFEIPGKVPVRITVKEFSDLILVDRTKAPPFRSPRGPGPDKL